MSNQGQGKYHLDIKMKMVAIKNHSAICTFVLILGQDIRRAFTGPLIWYSQESPFIQIFVELKTLMLRARLKLIGRTIDSDVDFLRNISSDEHETFHPDNMSV